jgi:hypothetical protein
MTLSNLKYRQRRLMSAIDHTRCTRVPALLSKRLHHPSFVAEEGGRLSPLGHEILDRLINVDAPRYPCMGSHVVRRRLRRKLHHHDLIKPVGRSSSIRRWFPPPTFLVM